MERGVIGGGWRRGFLFLPILLLGACDVDSILEVEDPDVILPGSVQGPTTLSAVHAHAIAEFSAGYIGDSALSAGEGQVLMSGSLTDELIHTGTFDSREIIDRRVATDVNPTALTPYQLLHRGRAAGDLAARLFEEFAPNTERHAEVQSLEGFAETIFGENFCSGVPFSRQTLEGALEYGASQTTTQIFQAALASFDAALAAAIAADSEEQENLARVGRARALLGLGRYAEAAAAAATVPTDFEYVMYHSETTLRQNNSVWMYATSTGIFSVAEQEGGNGLPFRSRGNIAGSILDPRIPVERIGLAQRGTLRPSEHWGQLKFPTRGSSTVLANGIEARLIEAEAALREGAAGVSRFVSLHNGLRTSVGLAPLSQVTVAAMTQNDRVDLHFEERAYWLYLTSHRLGDLRRMMWDYGRTQAQVFPSGTYFRTGAPYGTDTNFPVPFDEGNNPESMGCLTRDDAAGRDS